MFKRTITFPDLDENPVTEDFYFNMSIADLTRLEASANGGLSSVIEHMTKTDDSEKIFALFEQVVAMSVGKRADDNRRFLKSPEITSEFIDSNAYSTLFIELITTPGAMAEFMNALMPKALLEAVSKQSSSDSEGDTPVVDIPLPEAPPAWIAENREPTTTEVTTMTKAQLIEAYRIKNDRALRDSVPIAPDTYLPDTI